VIIIKCDNLDKDYNPHIVNVGKTDFEKNYYHQTENKDLHPKEEINYNFHIQKYTNDTKIMVNLVIILNLKIVEIIHFYLESNVEIVVGMIYHINIIIIIR
jgi:hypothetical protein